MILFAALMVCVDVMSRQILGVTLSGSDEVSGYLFAIATTLSLPYALLHRANVRIDAAYAQMGPRVRYGLDLPGWLMLCVCLILVFAATIAAGLRRDFRRARKIAGIPSVEEEIQGETAGVLPHPAMNEA